MTEHAGANGAPHHDDVRFEPRDVEGRTVWWFGAGLIVVLVVVGLGVWGMMVALNQRTKAQQPPNLPLADQERSRFREDNRVPVTQPLQESRTRRWRRLYDLEQGAARSRLAELPVEPGKPALQPADPRTEGIDIQYPEHTIGRLHESTAFLQRKEEELRLASYGWVNKEAGVAHIPITVAMQKVTKTLPCRPGKAPLDEWLEGPSRSSSGRVRVAGEGE